MKFLLLGAFAFLSIHAYSLPETNIVRSEAIPSVCQSCHPTFVKWGGEPHCAPAAVTNSLLWLSKNGYPELQPFKNESEQIAQAQLVNELGNFMGTTNTDGTSPYQVMSGLKKYLDAKKLKFKKMSAVGWRDVPEFVVKGNEKATLHWIQEGTLQNNSTWILVGWFKLEEKSGDLKIFAGHWFTVVGYGQRSDGTKDRNVIILKDPAARSERRNYYPIVEKLKTGTLVGNKGKDKYYPRSANEVLSLKGDYVMKPGATHGLIQGAYRLEL